MTLVAESGNGRGRLGGLQRLTRTELREVVAGQYMNETLLLERLDELELELEDASWIRQMSQAEQEFSASGLQRLIQLSRLMTLKNPLIDHAVHIQANYVWARGATFTAPNEQVNDIVQGFLNDRNNLAEFTSHDARVGKEVQVQIEGNLFFVLWTDTETAHVTVRTIPVNEILADDGIIYNPEDDREVWFYKRRYHTKVFDFTTGQYKKKRVTTYYPDWRYLLKVEEEDLDVVDVIGASGSEHFGNVEWAAPVYHLKTGGLPNWRFGAPEKYSAFAWAKAVTRDLEDYATLRRALARWAWSLTVRGTNSVKDAKTRLGTTRTWDSPSEGNPPPVAGSTFINKRLPDGTRTADLEPIRTAGAAPNPEEGRRLWLLVSAGTGIPETILAGNAEAGNLATAKTLDRPTELQMQNRQTLWADTFRDILGYVISRTKTMTNKIPDTIDVQIRKINPETREETVESETQEIDLSVAVEFPSILEREVAQQVTAIIDAATLGGKKAAQTMPDRILVDLLLRALGLNEEVGNILEEMFPDGSMWFATDTEPEEQVVGEGAEGTLEEETAELELPDLSDLTESGFRQGLKAFREALLEPAPMRSRTKKVRVRKA